MFVNKVKLLKTIKRTNIKLVTDSTTVEEAGSGGFWFPKMASRIINSQLRRLGRQCLLALPIKTTPGEASAGSLLLEGQGSESRATNNTAGTTSSLEH